MNKYFILIVCAGANLNSMNPQLFPKNISPVDACKIDLAKKQRNLLGQVAPSWNERDKQEFFECLITELILDLRQNNGGPKGGYIPTGRVLQAIQNYIAQNYSNDPNWRNLLIQRLNKSLNSLIYGQFRQRNGSTIYDYSEQALTKYLEHLGGQRIRSQVGVY
jgi:hypothetical protein